MNNRCSITNSILPCQISSDLVFSAKKRKFAGDPNLFKIEGLIETSKTKVELIQAAIVKAAINDVYIFKKNKKN